MTHLEFLADRIGSQKWVLAQRMTDGLRARYGSECVNVTRKRYAEIEKEYRTIYGDPYDKVRAELYRTLRDMADSFGHLCPKLKAQADAALAAEANAK